MIDTTTKEEWMREYDLMQNRACDAENENARLREALDKIELGCNVNMSNGPNVTLIMLRTIAEDALKGE